MSTDGVIKHLNITKDIAMRLLPGGIDVLADALTLEQLEEAFFHRIVMAVASPAHAGLQVMSGQESLPLVACKLAALV
jgi:hypothetical protein